MAECGKCGEQVDEAKAFCPACGHALVEERERAAGSNFDRMDKTVHLGNTVFNQMLTDMGLNTSRPPDAGHGLPEHPPAVSAPASRHEIHIPKAAAKAPGHRRTWVIVLAAGAALLFAALAMIAAAGLIYYMRASYN